MFCWEIPAVCWEPLPGCLVDRPEANVAVVGLGLGLGLALVAVAWSRAMVAYKLPSYLPVGQRFIFTLMHWEIVANGKVMPTIKDGFLPISVAIYGILQRSLLTENPAVLLAREIARVRVTRVPIP